jgi:hypothetical protein
LLPAGGGKNGRLVSVGDFASGADAADALEAGVVKTSAFLAASDDELESGARGAVGAGESAIPRISSREAFGLGAPSMPCLPTGSSAIILRIEAKISSIVGSLAFSAFAISVPLLHRRGTQKRP